MQAATVVFLELRRHLLVPALEPARAVVVLLLALLLLVAVSLGHHLLHPAARLDLDNLGDRPMQTGETIAVAGGFLVLHQLLRVAVPELGFSATDR